jgi:hypothetical protein
MLEEFGIFLACSPLEASRVPSLRKAKVNLLSRSCWWVIYDKYIMAKTTFGKVGS